VTVVNTHILVSDVHHDVANTHTIVANTHSIVSDMRRDMLKREEGTDDQSLTVSVSRVSHLAEYTFNTAA